MGTFWIFNLKQSILYTSILHLLNAKRFRPLEDAFATVRFSHTSPRYIHCARQSWIRLSHFNANGFVPCCFISDYIEMIALIVLKTFDKLLEWLLKPYRENFLKYWPPLFLQLRL